MSDITAGGHAATRQEQSAQGEDTVRVWDPLVRIFHWSLLASILAAWLTVDVWDKAHEWIGYAAGTLVAVRVIWGFIGTRHARFTDFVRGPRAVIGYFRQALSGHAPRYIGHNPAGGAMVLALLAVVSAIVVTGWMMTLDAFWGVEWVEDLHELLFDGLLVLVGLHVAGVIHASLAHRENLVRAMITGHKRP